MKDHCISIMEELQTVEGVGKHIAEQIKWAVNESMQTYG